MLKTTLRVGASALAFALTVSGARAQVAPAAPPAAPAATPLAAIEDGKPILEVRPRYEFVNQTKTAKLTDNAEAVTVRTHFGWRTGSWEHISALFEGSNVASLGQQEFAVNVPGATTPPLNGADKSRFPLVNDPNNTSLNRAQITWAPISAFSTTVGRQRVLIDDQRFVGNVNWRQDEQTFDAVRGDLKLRTFTLFAAYVDRVNRVLTDYPAFHSDSYLLNARWDPTKSVGVEVFDYLLRFDNAAINSSETRGVRGTFKAGFGALKLVADGTYAHQGDHSNTPTRFGLGFYAADLSATYKIVIGKLDYEQLDGNRLRGFTTPLATTHSFQGWADAFVSPGGNKSFVDGIKDYNVSLSMRPPIAGLPFFAKPEVFVRYNDFKDQVFGSDIGHEWDASLGGAVTPKIALLIKFARFDRDATIPVGAATPPASRTKFWVSLEYKL